MTKDTSDSRLEWRNWLSRRLQLDREEKFQIYVSLATSASPRDATYLAEIIFSAGIATLGLTLNSPAVIIGAMLISPLMGPILAGGLALAAGDFLLGLRALMNTVLSSLIAIGFSAVLVVLLPFREMTAEIAARTQPNTLDLVVALLSGGVGALAVSKSVRGIAMSIPGVAIAVALMPPLCVTGYGIGVIFTVDRVQGLAVLRGGGLLFVTNLVAITFASMLFFVFLHIDSKVVRDRIREWRREDPGWARFQRTFQRLLPEPVERIGSLPARVLLVAALVVGVFVPLKRSFDALSAEIRQRQHLNKAQRAATGVWEDLFGTTAGGASRSYIDRVDVAERDDVLTIALRAFISESISTEERDDYRRRVAKELGRSPATLRFAVVEIPTSTYQVARAKLETKARPAPAAESAGTRLMVAAQELNTRIGAAHFPDAVTPVDVSLSIGSGSPTATIVYLSAEPISQDARDVITAGLRDSLDVPTLDVKFEHLPARVTIRFMREREDLEEVALRSIDAIANHLRSRPDLVVRIFASDDTVSGKRSESVRAALMAHGVLETRLVQTVSNSASSDEVVLLIERGRRTPRAA